MTAMSDSLMVSENSNPITLLITRLFFSYSLFILLIYQLRSTSHNVFIFVEIFGTCFLESLFVSSKPLNFFMNLATSSGKLHCRKLYFSIKSFNFAMFILWAFIPYDCHKFLKSMNI